MHHCCCCSKEQSRKTHIGQNVNFKLHHSAPTDWRSGSSQWCLVSLECIQRCLMHTKRPQPFTLSSCSLTGNLPVSPVRTAAPKGSLDPHVSLLAPALHRLHPLLSSTITTTIIIPRLSVQRFLVARLSVGGPATEQSVCPPLGLPHLCQGGSVPAGGGPCCSPLGVAWALGRGRGVWHHMVLVQKRDKKGANGGFSVEDHRWSLDVVEHAHTHTSTHTIYIS